MARVDPALIRSVPLLEINGYQAANGEFNNQRRLMPLGYTFPAKIRPAKIRPSENEKRSGRYWT
ncbi:MAG: hypothetical protein CMJ77_12825 [Planctomycetaceae bacterium]|nr:hypothetical protein [Planctomycetaceae bacterium]